MPETQPDTQPRTNPASMTPSQIAAELSRYVIGQDEAVQRMALLVRQAALNAARPDGRGIRTPATLLVGASGCGKTLLARTSASLLDLPWVGEDATSLSAVGYVGKDLAAVVSELLNSCRGGVHRLESGSMIFLDEIDKTRRRPSLTGPDVGGENVQTQLLAILEGLPLQIQHQMHPDRRPQLVAVKTWGIWMVLAGSFAAGLSQIVRRRLGDRRRRIGFGEQDGPRDRRLREGELLALATEDDYVTFGMVAELVSRVIPITFRDLEVDDLRRILTDAVDGSLRRAEMLAARENVEIRWTPRLLDRIAAEAYASGLGARSLSSAISRVTRRLMYELPDVVRRRSSSTMLLVELDESALEDKGRYRIIRRRREV